MGKDRGVDESRLNHEITLARAYHHLQELERQVAVWRESDGYRLFHEYHRERREYVVNAEVDAPGNDPFSILTGDCLHNLSSALNFLAFDLSLAFTDSLPQDVAQDCEFPIFGDVDRKGVVGAGPRLFRNGATRKIRAMDPSARSVIEALQPYHQGSSFTDHPLWRLHELARFSRHRLLHPAVAMFSGFSIKVPGSIVVSRSINVAVNPFGVGTILSHAGVIEGRTVVARFPVNPIDPRREVYVDVDIPIDIAFAKGTPLVEGESMVDTLAGIHNHIVVTVLPALSPFI